MASFKEIKNHILSVRNTRKITSAMKLVSASKLHKAQSAISGMLPYYEALKGIVDRLLKDGNLPKLALAERREVKKVMIIAFSSNNSLCGAFNSNVARMLRATLKEYEGLPKEDVIIYAIGKRIAKEARKTGYKVVDEYVDLAERPTFEMAFFVADYFIDLFNKKEVDRVEIIYHHFKSTGTQQLLRQDFLPISIPASTEDYPTNYILEPSREELLDTLIPRSLKMSFYTAALDSVTSEHASRMIAMQIATDNADKLTNELSIEYNKSRQQAITNELLDIMGGQNS